LWWSYWGTGILNRHIRELEKVHEEKETRKGGEEKRTSSSSRKKPTSPAIPYSRTDTPKALKEA